MRKRYLKPWAECALIIIVGAQVMLAGSDTELDYVYAWALFQVINFLLLLLNVKILGKYGRNFAKVENDIEPHD